jgi:hypothetical protein
MQCSLIACQQNFTEFDSLIGHYKMHIRNCDEITCPFKHCSNKYNVVSSFSSHITRVHPPNPSERGASNSLAEGAVDVNDEFVEENTNENVSAENDIDMESECNISIEDEFQDTNEMDTIEDLYIRNLALFYLKLEAKYHVPASTVQIIVDELVRNHEMENNACRQLLQQKLVSEFGCTDTEKIEGILSEIESSSLFNLASDSKNGKLRSNYTRKQYYKEELGYIKPVAVKLGENSMGTTCHYHYIPIKDTLKALLADKSVYQQCFNTPTVPSQEPPQLYRDFTDGSIFRENELFQRLQDSLKIILYQDAFEIVNPLGSARKKHKIVGVYYTLGNLYPHHRSTIDQIQLVCVCRESDLDFFGADRLYRRLIKDLKQIESTGIDIGTENNVLGTVVSMLGDNLGSHCIGGFTCNFSTTSHMCRFCLIEKDMLFDHGIDPNAPSRSVVNYMNALQRLAAEPTLNHYEGVKHNSPFNSLKYYHVCNGLPPCLGHDLFEGIVQYDLAMALKDFIQAGWFSLQELNIMLKNFKLEGEEATNKPSDIGKGDKIGGHAVQNWYLLRFLPLIICHKVMDWDDSVWNMVILLREIVEYVCSPSITVEQIAYLDDLIKEYISCRCTLFEVRLRPKHHYLSHYPELILKFGPLIRLWTLRMESKHSYFKETARRSKNFINITHTLSKKHQLLQAYYSEGTIFPDDVECPQNTIKFVAQLYNDNVTHSTASQPEIDEESLVCHSITFRGTKYMKGQYVAVSRVDGCLQFGKITMIVVSTSGPYKPFLVVEVHLSSYIKRMGVYQLEESGMRDMHCIAIHDLIDYFPLNGKRIDGNDYLVLKHSIPDNFQ